MKVTFSARDGLRLAAEDWPGDPHRTPLLCLPGLTRSTADFARVAARIAGKRRVIALDPDNSLIIQKLSGTPPCGNPMPPGDMLTSAQVAEIRAWIVAGALNN